MFRQGRPRAFIHNLRLATMLSFVAGMVNITGVLAIRTLTTNVTGHFAFFAEDFVKGDYKLALTAIIYIAAFFVGAFVSGLLLDATFRVRPGLSHAFPILFELCVLVVVAFAFADPVEGNEQMACALLFAMGLQNAMVTKISKATVRTTHLTGLFTDLGIECAQLFFRRSPQEVATLTRSIYLRLAIIIFFFMGCVLGGFVYRELQLKTLLIASASLFIALLYDNIRFGFHVYRRRLVARTRRYL